MKTIHVNPLAAPFGDGTADKPFAKINECLPHVTAGDTLLLGPGTYREQIEWTASGTSEAPITIQAAEPGTVIWSGADILTGWSPSSARADVFEVAWESPFEIDDRWGCPESRCEQVIVDGLLHEQVLHEDQLRAGTFRVDREQGRLQLCPGVFPGEMHGRDVELDLGHLTGGMKKIVDRTDPSYAWPFLLKPFQPDEHCIEVATRRFCLFAGRNWVDNDYVKKVPAKQVDHLRVRGIRFRYGGNKPQQPIVQLYGVDVHLEDCVIEASAGRGLDFRGSHGFIRRCTFQHHGQMGFAGFGEDVLVEDCDLLYNNYKHSTFAVFENGGCKIVRTKRWTVRNCRAIGNDGPGIWFDIDNFDGVIERCWCEGNGGPGIMYEISFGGIIRNNICLRNGHLLHRNTAFNRPKTALGIADPAAYGQGILIQFSEDCQIDNNTCVGNRRVGIELRHHPYQQGEVADHPEKYRVAGNRVLNNIVADNGHDNLLYTNPPRSPGKEDEVGGYESDYNLVYNSQIAVEFGDLTTYARWAKHFGSGAWALEEWRVYSGQDLHSIQWDPAFVGMEAKDFRLEPWSPAIRRGKPIPELREDYHGNPRPADQPPTIGAVEFRG